MLESLRIKGFRRYSDFKLEKFNNINFILGDNNIGKTTVLESIFTWASGQNVGPMMNIPLSRARYSSLQSRYWIMEELLSMFNDKHSLPLSMSFEGTYNGEDIKFDHTVYPSDLLTDYDPSYKNSLDKIISRTNEVVSSEQPSVINLQMYNPISVGQWEVACEGKETIRVNITSPLSTISNVKPKVVAKYIDILSHVAVAENAQIYGALKREGLMEEVVSQINHIFPEIVGFDLLPYPDGSQQPISVVKKDGSLIPMYSCGDGVQRWFYIIGALTIYKNAILCIDEIDLGLHPNAQVDFCKNISDYAIKNNVQLFITTHNLEFIDKYLEAISDKSEVTEKVNVFTMRQSEDGNVAVCNLNATAALEMRKKFSMELR